MNKAELAVSVARQLRMPKDRAEEAVDAIFGTIISELSEGKKVQIVGFGSFEAKMRAAHTGHDPRTMKPMEIAESRVISFRAGKNLKDALHK